MIDVKCTGIPARFFLSESGKFGTERILKIPNLMPP